MKKEEIHLGDIHRIIFGQAPPEFMIEVFFRTILIFLFLLLVMRLMGKRMAGQVTLTELAVMVTLGGIVSPVMQLPDRGILFGVLVLICALLFQRGLNTLGVRNKKIEEITQGSMSLLVKDGKLVLDELEKANITKPQLFSLLREKKIYNLAKIDRAYFEACGILTVYENNKSVAGLPIMPQTDPGILSLQHELDSNMMACCNCGHVQHLMNKKAACEVCTATNWSKAYLTS